MNREFYISHGADRHNAEIEIRDIPYPYMLIVKRMPPEKEHTEEYKKRRKLLAYFHRGICPQYAEAAGITEPQAKSELQIKFARCGEVIISEAGEFDVVWLDEDRLRVMEQGKTYYVESVGSMGIDRLSEFCNKCRDYLLVQYGVHLQEFVDKFKTKEITFK